MNPNNLTIDFLAKCITDGIFDESKASALLIQLGKAIDRGIIYGYDVTDIKHCHDTILDLISNR